jgi:hypothetical protein
MTDLKILSPWFSFWLYLWFTANISSCEWSSGFISRTTSWMIIRFQPRIRSLSGVLVFHSEFSFS